MSVYTVNPDAIEVACDQIKTLIGEIGDHRQFHQRRAGRTREGLNDLLRKDFSGLESWAVQQFWDSLPLSGLGREFGVALEAERELHGRVYDVFATLANAHSGALHDRIAELGGPALTAFDAISGALGELMGWLTFGSLWSIIERPWVIEELLDLVWNQYGATENELLAARDRLEQLRQRVLEVIIELEGYADLLDRGITGGVFLRDVIKAVRSGKGLEQLLKESPKLGPLDAIGAVLSFWADGNYSAHSLGAHLYGDGLQIGLKFVPGVGEVLGLVDGTMAVVSLGSQGAAYALTTAGNAQGGRWGGLLKQAGANYTQTQHDADAWGHMYTDVGAMALDGHAGTILTAESGSPELAPAAFAAENALGSDYHRLPDDGMSLLQDGASVVSLPGDMMRAERGSAIVGMGEAAHFATERWVPLGARQTVDNMVYNATSAVLTFSNYL